MIQPEYKIADPICTFVFSFLVLCTTLTVLRDIMLIIMEGEFISLALSQRSVVTCVRVICIEFIHCNMLECLQWDCILILRTFLQCYGIVGWVI